MKTLADYMNKARKPRHEEQKIQDAILGAIKLRGLFAFPIRNHGLLNAKTGAYNRVERHHVAGVPDLAVLMDGGRILWVEVKTEKGRQSAEQIAVESRLQSLGHRYIVARNVDDVLTELSWFGE